MGSPKTTQKTSVETSVKTREKTREKLREKTREKILGLVRASANISTDEMAAQLGVTRKGIEWHIRKLKTERILRRIGPDKGGHWEVLK
jgi:ATP-dependent DNA helicase RecG